MSISATSYAVPGRTARRVLDLRTRRTSQSRRSGSGVAFDFQTTISGNTVTVAAGRRCIMHHGTNDAWEAVEASEFTYIDGGVVHMTMTCGAPPAWSAVLYSANPPTQSDSIRVHLIAGTATVSGRRVVTHFEMGSIRSLNIPTCEEALDVS